MKPIINVQFVKIGGDGFMAQFTKPVEEDFTDDEILDEFFSEDWKVLIDRVLFKLAEFEKEVEKL